jgi:hypothetical protein
MVLTIGPAGGGARRRELSRNYGIGLFVGGLVMGLTLAALGAALRTVAGGSVQVLTAAAGIAALAWLPRTSGLARGPRWPARSWQVPEQWRYTMPLPMTLLAFGFLLGLGFLTTPVLPVFWLLLVFSLAAPGPLAVLAAWLIYAGARWMMTTRKSREVAATGEVPGDVHGASGFTRMRRVSAGFLLVSVIYAASTSGLA